jgi:hypothetical protein
MFRRMEISESETRENATPNLFDRYSYFTLL